MCTLFECQTLKNRKSVKTTRRGKKTHTQRVKEREREDSKVHPANECRIICYRGTNIHHHRHHFVNVHMKEVRLLPIISRAHIVKLCKLIWRVSEFVCVGVCFFFVVASRIIKI